jgi:hypothetical protein
MMNYQSGQFAGHWQVMTKSHLVSFFAVSLHCMAPCLILIHLIVITVWDEKKLYIPAADWYRN